MRALLVPIIAFACMGATEDNEVQTLRPEPKLVVGNGISVFDTFLDSRSTIVTGGKMKARQDYLRTNCRDRLEKVQIKQPTIDPPEAPISLFGPKPAPDPLAIYAVDRREDGCGMMVMKGNPDDVRPVPELDTDDYRLMPAGTENGQ